MELQNRSSIVPSNAPALSGPFLEPTVSAGVLQERCGNRGNRYGDLGALWKQSPPTTVENLYSQGFGGAYFTGNVAAQLNGEKNEAQIQSETRKLLKNLRRCDKYQKYRERQPKNQKEEQDKQVWPDYLEESFFRALVRWPHMGRRKHMLDGKLRGRNELVADAIEKETGIGRTRKQVSSHIQVLKNYFLDQPAILIYMPKEDIGGKKRQASSHHRGRHTLPSPSRQSPKYGYGKGLCSGYDDRTLQSSAWFGTPYTVTNFAIYVQDRSKTPVHYFTQLASPDTCRMEDLNVTSLSAWNQQYPELKFHDTDEWKNRQVLVCDASIKIMMEMVADSEVAVEYSLRSKVDLSIFESLQCNTSFYDDGTLSGLRDDKKRAAKPTSRTCSYDAETGQALIHFGSGFWAHWMRDAWSKFRDARTTEDGGVRSRKLMDVRRSLQAMTAVQDISGINESTRESECFLTILWRFHQTRQHNDPGVMKWRVVNFSPLPPVEQPWVKSEETTCGSSTTMGNATTSTSNALATVYPSLPLEYTHQPFSHPLSHSLSHHHHHPPPLDFDNLSNIALDSIHDYSHPHSHPNSATAPGLSTDYSQTHSLPSLSHSQDTMGTGTTGTQSQPFHDANEIDFSGGNIGIVLEPAIDLSPYEGFGGMGSFDHGSQPHHQHQHQHHVHEHDVHGNVNTQDDGFADLGLNLSGVFPLPQKSWPFENLVERLEGVVEQGGIGREYDHNGHHGHGHGHGRDGHGHENGQRAHSHTHAHYQDLEIVGHGVLHGGALGDGLWKLQSAFGEDTGVGALDGEEVAHGGGKGEGLDDVGTEEEGLRILELMERDRGRKDSFRGF